MFLVNPVTVELKATVTNSVPAPAELNAAVPNITAWAIGAEAAIGPIVAAKLPAVPVVGPPGTPNMILPDNVCAVTELFAANIKFKFQPVTVLAGNAAVVSDHKVVPPYETSIVHVFVPPPPVNDPFIVRRSMPSVPNVPPGTENVYMVVAATVVAVTGTVDLSITPMFDTQLGPSKDSILPNVPLYRVMPTAGVAGRLAVVPVAAAPLKDPPGSVKNWLSAIIMDDAAPQLSAVAPDPTFHSNPVFAPNVLEPYVPRAPKKLPYSG